MYRYIYIYTYIPPYNIYIYNIYIYIYMYIYIMYIYTLGEIICINMIHYGEIFVSPKCFMYKIWKRNNSFRGI